MQYNIYCKSDQGMKASKVRACKQKRQAKPNQNKMEIQNIR